MLAILCKKNISGEYLNHLFLGYPGATLSGYFQTKQVLAKFQLKMAKISDDIPKTQTQTQILPQSWVILGPYIAKVVFKYPNLKECPNFLMYTMEIQVLTEFQLKITMIGETISKKVILPQIRPIFGILWPKFSQNRKI